MQLSSLDLGLWLAGLLGNVALLAALWGRGRMAAFPVFTTWIAANVVRTVALFFVHRFGSKDAYFYAYWTLAIIDVAMQFGVLYEAALRIFRPRGQWAPGVRANFLWIAGLSVAAGAVLTSLGSPPAANLLKAILIRGNFLSSVLMSELFVAMIVLSATMGLPWRTHVARIAQGLGAYSLFGIVTEAMHTYFGLAHGPTAYTVLSRIRMAAYLSCLGFWIVTLARDAPEERQLPPEMELQLLLLQNRASALLSRLRASSGA